MFHQYCFNVSYSSTLLSTILLLLHPYLRYSVAVKLDQDAPWVGVGVFGLLYPAVREKQQGGGINACGLIWVAQTTIQLSASITRCLRNAKRIPWGGSVLVQNHQANITIGNQGMFLTGTCAVLTETNGAARSAISVCFL
jgi:hypothetical protein